MNHTPCQLKHSSISRVQRWVYAFAGLACVGLGAVGVIVPGLPTTIFLIAACWLFTRSCPWLERKLIRNRFFGPYLRYLDGGCGMPMRAKLITLLIMWTSVMTSTLLLFNLGDSVWPPVLTLVAAVLGTVVIVRLGGGRDVENSSQMIGSNRDAASSS